jgi:hypothetical protein
MGITTLSINDIQNSIILNIELFLKGYAYCFFLLHSVSLFLASLSRVSLCRMSWCHLATYMNHLLLRSDAYCYIFVMLVVIIPIVINLSVVMLNVVAPSGHLHEPLGCPPIWIIYSRKCRSTLWYHPRGQSYKTNFVRNLQIFILCQSVCHWQAFPAYSNKHSSFVQKFVNRAVHIRH